MGGSPTREKLQAEKDLFTKAGEYAALATGGGGGLMIASMRKKAATVIFGPENEKFLADIGKMLVSRNQAQNQLALDKIFGRLGMTQAPPKVKEEAAAYLVPLIVGQQVGKLQGGGPADLVGELEGLPESDQDQRLQQLLSDDPSAFDALMTHLGG